MQKNAEETLEIALKVEEIATAVAEIGLKPEARYKIVPGHEDDVKRELEWLREDGVVFTTQGAMTLASWNIFTLLSAKKHRACCKYLLLASGGDFYPAKQFGLGA